MVSKKDFGQIGATSEHHRLRVISNFNPDLVDQTRICIVGLGYVGLPLALAFGRTNIKTLGFDISKERIDALKTGYDFNHELSPIDFQGNKAVFTDQAELIKTSNFIIIAVPTPVTTANQPDLSLVKKASELVGKNLVPGSIVVYESTVYPGCTEEVCVPILQQFSGLKFQQDFKVGYSPERINPGDLEHTLETIIKVVAGCDEVSTSLIAQIYQTVCRSGVFIAANIKTAEAAKVIENTQRDLNIALINELSLIFHRLGINTSDVLAAAGTKWNFLRFTPGLVGGHCIGVDPYYLVYKAEEVGYHPQVITAGRRVNDYMPEFVAGETIKALIESGGIVQESKVLVMGLTFKENVKDCRNSKISITIEKLKEFGVKVFGYDPLLSPKEIEQEFAVTAVDDLANTYDGVIVAVAHKQFVNQEKTILSLIRSKRPLIVVDVRNIFPSLKNQPDIIYKNL